MVNETLFLTLQFCSSQVSLCLQSSHVLALLTDTLSLLSFALIRLTLRFHLPLAEMLRGSCPDPRPHSQCSIHHFLVPAMTVMIELCGSLIIDVSLSRL